MMIAGLIQVCVVILVVLLAAFGGILPIDP